MLLVLLIIFMVITPLDAARTGGAGAPAARQEQAAAGYRPAHGGDHHRQETKHDAEPRSRSKKPSCRTRLEDIFKTRAERVVFVKGDPGSRISDVAQAIDIAKGAQIDKIGLMTPKVEAGQ